VLNVLGYRLILIRVYSRIFAVQKKMAQITIEAGRAERHYRRDIWRYRDSKTI